MLDTTTLRVAFGLVALCVLVLSYGSTYRSTRSAYSGWWCVSLASFICSALLFLLDGTSLQVVGNPLGNCVAVFGAACVWAGGRSLRTSAPSPRQLAFGPVVVLIISVLDDPANDSWTGGAVYLMYMAVLMGLSTWELVLLLRGACPAVESRRQHRFAVVSMAIASGGIAVFSLFRAIFFLAVGPDHPAFAAGFGSQATTLLTMLLLVVVTFNMSALGHEQQTSELRVRATLDGLTGAVNRTEFLRSAQRRVDLAGTPAATVIVADLDHFKGLNDRFGHAAGDRALVTFADVCRSVLGPGGVVSRFGGDEFVLLTDGPAEDLAAEVARLYRTSDPARPLPSVSFGIASAGPGDDVAGVITRADIALYQAKAAGRGCAVRYDGHLPVVAGGVAAY